MAKRHAMVMGASGSAGWAVVDELLKGYGNFTSVSALVNRPLTREAAGWDSSSTCSLQIVAGVDLTKDSDEWCSRVDNIERISHVFNTAFKQEDEPAQEVRINGQMVANFTKALNAHCPALQMFVQCSGARYYQRQCGPDLAEPLRAPFTEDMIEHATPEVRSGVFYYTIRAALQEACAGQQWSYCEIVPDAIVSFAPSGSTFAIQILWATWLATYAAREGQGTRVACPGTKVSYNATFNGVSGRTIAHEMIWAGLNSDKTAGGEIFNAADSNEPSTMAQLFPRLAAHFGLQGVGPPADLTSIDMPSAYVEKHGHLLDEKGVQRAKIWKAPWLDVYGTMYTYDRHMSLGKVRKAGFSEDRAPLNGWVEVFDRMKAAGMLPL